MKVFSFFSTEVYTAEMPRVLFSKLNPKLAQECDLFRAEDRAGARWSKTRYPGRYTSYSSVTDLPFRSTNFGRLKSWIDQEVLRYSRSLDWDLQGGKLKMGTCWINMMGPGSHHSFHLHPLSAISGTYYVSVPKGSGVFRIEDPRLSSFMGAPPRPVHIDLKPKAGQLVLFESWLKHEVPSNLSSETRISVSFNYDWVK